LVIYNIGTSDVNIVPDTFSSSSIEIITIHQYPNGRIALLGTVKTNVSSMTTPPSVFSYNIPSV
jgi:hypothetical protein